MQRRNFLAAFLAMRWPTDEEASQNRHPGCKEITGETFTAVMEKLDLIQKILEERLPTIPSLQIMHDTWGSYAQKSE